LAPLRFQADCFYAGLAFVKDHAVILAALAIAISSTMVSSKIATLQLVPVI
jgi:hypothetical protein